MGNVEEEIEIIAEPDEPGFLESFFFIAHQFIRANGWYILLAGGAIYYVWKNKLNTANQRTSPKSAQDLEAWQAKEEQRLKAIQRLQEKYEKDAAAKAEKQKLLDEQKQKARQAELEDLKKKAGGHRLGDSSKSLRPEYNPLMGDTGSSDRVCFRRPGGGSGG